jgi:signal transduction histidine kinase
MIVMLGLWVASFGLLRKSSGALEHTMSVRMVLDETLLALVDAETGERGYIITGKAEYLEPYHRGSARVAEIFSRLRALTADNPAQKTHIDDLERLTAVRLEALRIALDAFDGGGIEAARDTLEVNKGKETMDQIRAVLTTMSLDEDRLLDERRHEQTRNAALMMGAMIVTALLLGLLLVLWTLERRSAYEQARIAELREHFMGILGHDLRSPLSALCAGAAMLRRSNAVEEDKARLMLDRMQSSCARMARMIDQTLDLTRARLGGGIPVSPTNVDLCAIVDQVVAEFRATRGDHAIDVHSSGGQLEGKWDADRLGQVVSNLIGNALTYRAPDTPVRVECASIGDEVVLNVHNTGPCIPDEKLASLFEPFVRGDEERRTTGAGLGLGLFITREIVCAHGGHIEVDSSRDEGTTFTVRLPRDGQKTRSRSGRRHRAFLA